MKKTILILVVILSLSILLVGCDSNKIKESPETVANTEEDTSNELETNDDTVVDKNKEEVPIHPDDIAPEITILEPNSIGTVYMEAAYTNNSKYPITSYSAKILLKDKNETTYLTNNDTVLPGETSPIFDCFGPDTRNEEDYEILTLDLRARLDNGKTLAIEYDYKLGEARWNEYD